MMCAQEDLMLVGENTRRNLEQEIAGFHAQAAAGERAMQARPMLALDPSSSQECLRPVTGAHVTPVGMPCPALGLPCP